MCAQRDKQINRSLMSQHHVENQAFSVGSCVCLSVFFSHSIVYSLSSLIVVFGPSLCQYYALQFFLLHRSFQGKCLSICYCTRQRFVSIKSVSKRDVTVSKVHIKMLYKISKTNQMSGKVNETLIKINTWDCSNCSKRWHLAG